MLGRPTLVLALFAIVIAGCISPAASNVKTASLGGTGDVVGDRVPVPDKDLSKAIVSDHGAPYMHAIQSLHTGSYRMDLVGYNPMTSPTGGEDPEIMNSAYTAITIFHHLACLSHWAGSGGIGGADIIDFENPAKPTIVASIPDLMIGSRCEFTEDGKFLLVASYGGATAGLPLGRPEGDLLANGVSVYDVSDVKHPKFLQHSTVGLPQGDAPLSSAYHNVGTALINGTNYVFQTYTGNILALSSDGKTLKVVNGAPTCT